MKNLGGKLKNLNFKQFFVQHGEKVGVGCVAMIIVFGLIKTDWAAYERVPEDLKEAAQKADENINKSVWPEDKQAEVAVRNFLDQARMMVQPLDVEKYSLRIPFSEPLQKPEQLITESKWNPLEKLIVDSDEIIVELMPEVEFSLTEEELALLEKKENPNTPDNEVGLDRRRREDVSGRKRAPGELRGNRNDDAELAEVSGSRGRAPSGARGRNGRAGRGARGGNTQDRRRGDRGERDNRRGRDGDYDEEPMMYARGERFAALRAVFDLRKQERQLGRALRFSIPEDAKDKVLFRNFKVQRQRAVSGPNPWSDGNWEDIDIQTAISRLAQMADFDSDVIDPRVTDSAITMPLPRRLLGYWTYVATHPQLEQFTLSEEEREQIDKLNKLFKEEYEKMEKVERSRSGGFTDLVFDINKMRDRVLLEKEAELQEKLKEQIPNGVESRVKEMFGLDEEPLDAPGAGGRAAIGNRRRGGNRRPTRGGGRLSFGGGGGDDHDDDGGGGGRRGTGRRRTPGRARRPSATRGFEEEELMTGIEAAAGRMLLFRYFDFTVQPGEAYRYRVKLVFENPNFERGLRREDVDDEAVILGETRESEWSEPSAVVVIPYDTQTFVTKTNGSRGPGNNGADFEVFQWHRKFGTTIKDNLQCIFGQFIGGPKSTLVLNIAKPSFISEPVTFTSELALVDALPAPKIELNDHPDLKKVLSSIKGVRSSGTTQVGIPAEAVVISQDGRISRLDSLSSLNKRNGVAKEVKAVRDQFLDLKELGNDPYAARDLMGPGRRGGGGFGGGRANTMRKGGRGRAASGDSHD